MRRMILPERFSEKTGKRLEELQSLVPHGLFLLFGPKIRMTGGGDAETTKSVALARMPLAFEMLIFPLFAPLGTITVKPSTLAPATFAATPLKVTLLTGETGSKPLPNRITVEPMVPERGLNWIVALSAPVPLNRQNIAYLVIPVTGARRIRSDNPGQAASRIIRIADLVGMNADRQQG